MSLLSRNAMSMLVAAAVTTLGFSGSHAQDVPGKVDAVASLLPQSFRDSGVLRIAVTDAGKPIGYKEGADIKGMDPDLAHAIAGVLGLKPDISFIPFSAALVGLQADRFDISYGEFYVTAERLKVADFVTNWQDYSSFLVTKAGDYRPTKLDDICGRNVGAMAGAAEIETLKTASSSQCGEKAATVSAFPSTSDAILALNSGRVDGILISCSRAQEAINLDGGLDASGEIGGGPTATAVARTENSAELLAAIKAAYDHLIESGDYARILEKNDTAYGATKEARIYTESDTPPKYGF